MKKYVGLLAGLCALLCLVGCNTPEEKDSPIKSMNITDAATLFVGAANTTNRSARAAEDTDTLFKILDDGSIEKVEYYDDDGKAIKNKYYPTRIMPVNEDYILMCFDHNPTLEMVSVNDYAYLVRKSDGACFDLAPVGQVCTLFENFKNGKLVQIDKDDNIYLAVRDPIKVNEILVKIDLKGIDSLTCEYVSNENDSVKFFAIDEDGNAMYFTEDSKIKIKNSKTGKITKAPSAIDIMWTGIDGKIYCSNKSEEVARESEEGYVSYPVCKVVFDEAGAATLETVDYLNSSYRQWDSNIVYLNNRILIFSYEGEILEVYNDSMELGKVVLEGLNVQDFAVVGSNGNYYYVAGSEKNGKSFLIQVDSATDKYVHLLDGNRYEVYSFTPAADGTITFSAEDADTGNTILAEVKEGDEEPEVLSENTPKITVLERIK